MKCVFHQAILSQCMNKHRNALFGVETYLLSSCRLFSWIFVHILYLNALFLVVYNNFKTKYSVKTKEKSINRHDHNGKKSYLSYLLLLNAFFCVQSRWSVLLNAIYHAKNREVVIAAPILCMYNESKYNTWFTCKKSQKIENYHLMLFSIGRQNGTDTKYRKSNWRLIFHQIILMKKCLFWI